MSRTHSAGVRFLTFLFASCVVTSAADAHNILTGHWEGAIVQPAGELRIVVDFTAASDTFTGTFYLPDAAVFRWPLKVEYGAPRLTFRLPMGLLFEGEVLGDSITGAVPSPSGGHTDPPLHSRTGRRKSASKAVV